MSSSLGGDNDDKRDEILLPKNHGDPKFSDVITRMFHQLSKEVVDVMARNKKMRAGEYKPLVAAEFYKWWRDNAGDNFFPLMRILLPNSDRSRPPYNLREKALADLIIDLLGIEKDSAEGRKLKDYQSAAKSRHGGDFVSVCYDAIKKRITATSYSDITVNELNDLLDRLAQAGKKRDDEPDARARKSRQKAVLQELLGKRLNAEEWRYTIMMIIKAVRINLDEKVILSSFHEDAATVIGVNNDLKMMCAKLYNPSARLEQKSYQVLPMNVYRPQLASHVPTAGNTDQYDKAIELFTFGKNNTDSYKGFYIEEKLDGERLQLHMQSKVEEKWLSDSETKAGGRFDLDTNAITRISAEKNKDGKHRYKVFHREFSYYSRHAKDYSAEYGIDKDHGWVSPVINMLIASEIENIVLDGEVIAYDPLRKVALPFGTLKTFFGQQIDLTVTGPKYVAFDILYLNNMSVMKLPLHNRKRLLMSAFIQGRCSQPPELLNRFDILPFNGPLDDENGPLLKVPSQSTLAETMRMLDTDPRASTADDIRSRMRTVIEDASEGIVVKDPDSVYSINTRERSWLKFKPEYLGEMRENLDLLVVGAYMGKGNRGGIRASYLVAVQSPDRNKFWTFCKVGGGFTRDDFETIDRKCGSKFKKFDRKTPPVHIDFGNHVKPDDWPHEYIEPYDSIVFEVKASEIIETTAFRCGLTVRFPRFSRIREDKDYTSCTTYDQMVKMRGEIRHLFELKDQEKKKARRRGIGSKKRRHIMGRRTDLSEVSIDSKIFDGIKFHVTNFAPTRISPLIKKNGGTITGMDRSKYIITNELPSILKDVPERAGIDVLSGKFIDDCVEAGRVVAIEPCHILAGTEKTVEAANQAVDKYGDPYNRHVSINELSAIFQTMPNHTEAPHDALYDIQQELRRLEAEGDPLHGMILTGEVLYFARPQLYGAADEYQEVEGVMAMSEREARMCGAIITSNLNDPTLTLVIVDQNYLDPLEEVKASLKKRPLDAAVRIVDRQWVESCWMEQTKVDPARFATIL